ncbi:hypothetical protein PN462_06265 [Spirulina sp. CS-785/01]|uniref:hypothetical protein n=1 Tax=Spirulina sp. CS-785/01 TaxID=3021716 RepID=UPI00232EE2A4|nr:hypothetical protein [Spirulina sp. CS-785/01]MDB9312698.1 hypothetical protein [Spirulina sp. CS-785/01]
MNHFAALMDILRDRIQFFYNVREKKNLEQQIFSLLISSCILFALYGAIMGSASGGLQILVSALKLPALYLLTMVICLPALYFFNTLSGAYRTFSQYVAIFWELMRVNHKDTKDTKRR